MMLPLPMTRRSENSTAKIEVGESWTSFEKVSLKMISVWMPTCFDLISVYARVNVSGVLVTTPLKSTSFIAVC